MLNEFDSYSQISEDTEVVPECNDEDDVVVVEEEPKDKVKEEPELRESINLDSSFHFHPKSEMKKRVVRRFWIVILMLLFYAVYMTFLVVNFVINLLFMHKTELVLYIIFIVAFGICVIITIIEILYIIATLLFKKKLLPGIYKLMHYFKFICDVIELVIPFIPGFILDGSNLNFAIIPSLFFFFAAIGDYLPIFGVDLTHKYFYRINLNLVGIYTSLYVTTEDFINFYAKFYFLSKYI